MMMLGYFSVRLEIQRNFDGVLRCDINSVSHIIDKKMTARQS